MVELWISWSSLSIMETTSLSQAINERIGPGAAVQLYWQAMLGTNSLKGHNTFSITWTSDLKRYFPAGINRLAIKEPIYDQQRQAKTLSGTNLVSESMPVIEFGGISDTCQ